MSFNSDLSRHPIIVSNVREKVKLLDDVASKWKEAREEMGDDYSFYIRNSEEIYRDVKEVNTSFNLKMNDKVWKQVFPEVYRNYVSDPTLLNGKNENRVDSNVIIPGHAAILDENYSIVVEFPSSISIRFHLISNVESDDNGMLSWYHSVLVTPHLKTFNINSIIKMFEHLCGIVEVLKEDSKQSY